MDAGCVRCIGELLREHIHDDGDGGRPLPGGRAPAALAPLPDAAPRDGRLPRHVAVVRRHHAADLALRRRRRRHRQPLPGAAATL